MNANVAATDADDQAGFYVLGDEVNENGLATEFCAIGKVNTDSLIPPTGPNVTITGRVIFFVVRARAAANEDTESGDEMVQEYSIVGREAVTYMTSRRLLQLNGMIVESCMSDVIEVEKGDLIGVFIRSACIRFRGNTICPLQVNFIGDDDYGVGFFNDSDTFIGSSNTISNDELESDVLWNPLISINETFLNVQVTIEPGTYDDTQSSIDRAHHVSVYSNYFVVP